MYHLRQFNNWVKAVLIKHYAPADTKAVLDLACGKGSSVLLLLRPVLLYNTATHTNTQGVT